MHPPHQLVPGVRYLPCTWLLTQSLDYLGAQCWQRVETLTTQQLWFQYTVFRVRENNFNILSQDIGIIQFCGKNPAPLSTNTYLWKPHYFLVWQLRSNQSTILSVGAGNSREKLEKKGGESSKQIIFWMDSRRFYIAIAKECINLSVWWQTLIFH